MNSINIQTLSPKDILVKAAFKRALPSECLTVSCAGFQTGDAAAQYEEGCDPLRFELLTQSDFLREFDVNSHKINSLKYYPNPLRKDDDGKFYAKIKSRVAIGFQERIFVKRLTALVGNNTNLRITSAKPTEKDQEMLGKFREGWEKCNIENAIYEALSADGKTGDCAVCFFVKNKKLGYRVFSFEKGDILYPHYDPETGKLALFGRRYSLRDGDDKEISEYLDVWDEKYYARYKKDKKGIKGAKNKVKDLLGLNGWVIDQPLVRHNFKTIPIAYDRYGEPFWANSQSLIDSYEMAISQLCENNAAYALRILYSFGEEMDMKSSIDGTPLSINSPDPNARVGFLEPADSSNSFTLQLSTLEKNIMRSSFAVETPEIKSGADMSSLTVKMLFADAYLKALDDSMHFQPFLDSIVELFKYGYGIEVGQSSDFNTFGVKAELFPYIFQSETEVINSIVQLKGIGALSQRSASEMAYEYGYGVVGENERINQEAHDALVGPQPASNKDTNVIANARNAQ